MDLDYIQPFRSVGGLILGWTESRVVEALGESYLREIDEYGDLSIQYDDIGIRCTFWKSDDFRLGWISVERPAALLLGKKLFGESKAEIERLVTATLRTVIAENDGCIHEDGSLQEWIDVETHDLIFWFDDAVLYEIDVTCNHLDDNTPVWPSE